MIDPAVANQRALALFLDIDGTLLDLAATPEAVRVAPRLPALLSRLCEQLNGALALISGRQLQDIDRLFAPCMFSAAGVHGCELRVVDTMVTACVDTQRVAEIHQRCSSLRSISSKILVECKTYGAALHYRLAPELAPLVEASALQLLAEIGQGFELQPGKCVYEIKPAGFSKGTAIAALMSRPPFATRLPVFIGDDATDEHGFAAATRLAGIAIKVGHEGPSIAARRVACPAEVHRLLGQLSDGLHALTGGPDWFELLAADKITHSWSL